MLVKSYSILLLIILTTICDYYLFSLPVKFYYLPFIFLLVILFQKNGYNFVKVRLSYIVYICSYLFIIIISTLNSSFPNTYGYSSPIIFFSGVLINIGIFYLTYSMWNIELCNTYIKAISYIALVNAIISIILFVISNFIGKPIGNMFLLSGTNIWRAAGLYAEPDIFGFYTSTITLVLLPFIYTKRKSLYLINLPFLAFFFSIIANLISFTRTTLLSLIICIFYYLWLKGKKSFIIFCSIALLAIIGVSSIAKENPILSRFSINSHKTDNGAFDSRLYNVYMTLNNFNNQKILFGAGPGYLYDLAFDKTNRDTYASGGDINTNRNGTFFILGELFNTGILGLLILIILLIYLWRKLRVDNLKYKYNNDKLIIGAKLILLNALIVSCSNTVIKMPFIWIFIAIGCKALNGTRIISKKLSISE